MTLAPGVRLGPYEILAPLGAGGMGEVYRARDTRLGREVALKVLPAELSGDVERLRRFEQEARAASALNHPNIVVVHDVGVSDSISYIAMERVEGKSLRELMAPGLLSVRRIFPLATQIAEGLARAHAGGIVHRDLKPENVMVSEDGFVKILDFGLAKLVLPPSEELTAAPTAAMEAPRTRSGVILGTVGYMSPEQAAGREVDYHSDQFSFGSILYEMATGRRAFQGDSAAQTLAAIIQEEPPPIASLRPEVPSPFCWIIERCLAKAPAERYDSTRDLARELGNLRDRLSGASLTRIAPGRPARGPAWRRALAWAVTAALSIALLASLLARRGPGKAANESLMRFWVAAPEGAGFGSGEIFTNSAISPDGRSLALVAGSLGRNVLYVRRLDSLDSRVVPGTEGAASPFWSPDSRLLAFFAEGKLKKSSPGGGPAQTICKASWEGVGSWNREGRILFSEAVPGREGIYSVSSDGGEATRVTTPNAERGEKFHFWPHFLPDGRHFLYVALIFGSGFPHEVRIGSLDSKETKSLGSIDSRVEYAPPGFLLFVREGTLLARPFDAKTLRWAGEAQPVAERVHYFFGPGNAGFSVSQNGVLAYERGKTPSRVVWIDRRGKETSTVAALEQVADLRLSPDGRQAALAAADARFGTSDIWVFDLSRGVSTRLTSEPTDEVSPIWSPEGRRIIFRSDRNGPPDVYEIASTGGGDPRPLLELGGVETPQDFSPDGKSLLYTQANRTTGLDLWLLPLFGERKPVSFLRTRFDEDRPRFSPGGDWVAYDSTETGGSEIYVTSRDGRGGRTRVSTDGGYSPRWRRDEKELFYLAPGRRVMAAPVKTGAAFDAGAPVELFRFDSAVFDYDVGPDGQRFLVSEAAKPPGPPIAVVANWPAALRERR
jgi:Tol biopolymer transport system component